MAHPELPWIEMRGMRNKMIHDYFDVDVNVVRSTVTNDLLGLEQQIDELLNSYGVALRREHRNQTAPDESPRPLGRRGDNPHANQLDNFRTRLKNAIKNPRTGRVRPENPGVLRNIRPTAFDPLPTFPAMRPAGRKAPHAAGASRPSYDCGLTYLSSQDFRGHKIKKLQR